MTYAVFDAIRKRRAALRERIGDSAEAPPLHPRRPVFRVTAINRQTRTVTYSMDRTPKPDTRSIVRRVQDVTLRKHAKERK